MTKDDALIAIKKIVPSLTADDVIGLQNCTEMQLEAILAAYKSSGLVASKDLWTQIADVLKQVPDWAQIALSILGVVARLFP